MAHSHIENSYLIIFILVTKNYQISLNKLKVPHTSFVEIIRSATINFRKFFKRKGYVNYILLIIIIIISIINIFLLYIFNT